MTKCQAPSTKQIPNSKLPMTKTRAVSDILAFEFGTRLVLDAWCLVLRRLVLRRLVLRGLVARVDSYRAPTALAARRRRGADGDRRRGEVAGLFERSRPALNCVYLDEAVEPLP